MKRKEVFLSFFGVLSKLSLSSSHQVFLKWRILSLKYKEVFRWRKKKSFIYVFESSPSESFIKSSSLSELESQSFVEEKTKSFWVITSLQSKSFSTPSLSFRRKSSKSFNESFVEETKSFCLMIYEVGSYYPQKICSYPHRLYEASLSLKKSFTNIFFFWKKSLSLPLMSFLSKKSQSFTTQE